MQSTFLALIVFGCISIVSSQQQCYSCLSSSKAGCGDPFDRNAMTSSERTNLPNGGVCLKTKVEGNGVVSVTRAAAPTTIACPKGSNGCDEDTKDGVTGTVCCCTGNLCNGTSKLHQQPLMILFLLVATLSMIIIHRHF